MKDCHKASDPAKPLVFCCSGASVAGHVTDLAARMLHKMGTAQMLCLAGIGGRDGSILSSTRQASRLLVIDGCPADCAKKTLEAAGLTKFHHLRATQLLGAERDTIQVDPTFDRLMRDSQAALAS